MCWKSWLATGNKAAISSYKGTIYDSKIQTWYPHTITSRQNSLAIMTAHSTETTKHVCYGCAVKPWLILWNFANGQSEETLEWKISCCTVFILVIVLVIRVSQKQPGFHTSNQHFKSGVGRRRTKGSGGMPLSPLIFTFSEVDSEAMFSTLSVKICQVLVLPTGSTTDSSLEGLGEGGYPEWGKEGYPPPLYIASWAEPNPREKRRVGRHVYTRICSTARILQSNQITVFKCLLTLDT